MMHGPMLCGVGVALGVVAAFGLTRCMEALPYGVEAFDPMTFGVVAISLTVVALMASYIPAARAVRINPVEAIWYDTWGADQTGGGVSPGIRMWQNRTRLGEA